MKKNVVLLLTDKVYMEMASRMKAVLLESVANQVSIAFTTSPYNGSPSDIGPLTDVDFCIIVDCCYSENKEYHEVDKIPVDEQLKALVRIGNESGNMNLKAISLYDIADMFDTYGGTGDIVDSLGKIFDVFPDIVNQRNLLYDIGVYHTRSWTKTRRGDRWFNSENMRKLIMANESSIGIHPYKKGKGWAETYTEQYSHPFRSCPVNVISDEQGIRNSSMTLIPDCTVVMENSPLTMEDINFVHAEELPLLRNYEYAVPVSEMVKFVDGKLEDATPLTLYQAMLKWKDSDERKIYMKKLDSILNYIDKNKLSGKPVFVDIANLATKDSSTMIVHSSCGNKYHEVILVG